MASQEILQRLRHGVSLDQTDQPIPMPSPDPPPTNPLPTPTASRKV